MVNRIDVPITKDIIDCDIKWKGKALRIVTYKIFVQHRLAANTISRKEDGGYFGYIKSFSLMC